MYSMFSYLLCCFYFGKLISSGPTNMSGVSTCGERISMSGWVGERAMHLHLIRNRLNWQSF